MATLIYIRLDLADHSAVNSYVLDHIKLKSAIGNVLGDGDCYCLDALDMFGTADNNKLGSLVGANACSVLYYIMLCKE